ncbi:MAG: hypothetical protein WC436_05455 [Candidatus Babeliales bacterium]
MNKDLINKKLEHNFCLKVSSLPLLHSSMLVKNMGYGITQIDAAVASDTFNVVCGGDFTDLDIASKVSSIVQYYTSKQYPFAWWIGPSNWNNTAHEILTNSGLIHTETEIGMAGDAKDILTKFKIIEGFTYLAVKNENDLHDFGLVMASVFDPFDEEALRFYKMIAPYYNNEKIKMFVGYIDKIPAAICSCVIDDKFGGIYDIVTNPKFQKRGLGTL